MELEYVANAVRRYWFVVLGFSLLGLVGAAIMSPDSVAQYRSTALILVTDDEGSASNDRYVSGELIVLESPAVAQRAAELAGGGSSATTLSDAVTFVQIPSTDVVRIIASAESPTQAQAFANAYVDAYIAGKNGALGNSALTDPATMEQQTTELEDQLSEVERQIEEALSPYLQGDVTSPAPAVEDVAPTLAARRDVLLEQYRSVLLEQSAFELAPQQSAARSVIQRAELPEESLATSARTLQMALSLGGFLVGVCAATLIARSSRFVLNRDEAGRILGTQILHDLPNSLRLRQDSLEHLADLPDRVRDAIDELCVQVEVQSPTSGSWSVVVAGSRRVAGTSTVAAAMAMKYAQLGSRVLLVDFDLENSEIARRFDAERGGRPELLCGGVGRDEDLPDQRIDPLNLTVMGAPDSDTSAPSRQDLVAWLEDARRNADVVVVDVGPLLTSSSATLAKNANAIVLNLPLRQQTRNALRVIAQQLANSRATLFVVATPKLRKRRGVRQEAARSAPLSSHVEQLPSPSMTGRPG